MSGVTLVPLAPAHVTALRRIRAEPEVARWWDAPEADFPLLDEPDCVRHAIVVDGEVVGMVQFTEELEPRYRCAAIDIFVSAAHHDRGVGTAAVRQTVAHLTRERGHHRITIDPTIDNAAAVRCYAKAGFLPVGVQRRAERRVDGAGWDDALLMELVVGPEPAADGPAALELRLHDPAVRASTAALSALLHPAFVEHGASGRRFTLADILARLPAAPELDASRVAELREEPIAPGVALVTYRIDRRDGVSTWRSSTWVQTSGGWRLRFHQGTPCVGPAAAGEADRPG